MTIIKAMNTALSGLTASQGAMTLTSNNLTSVNDPNYTRKIAVFQTESTNGIKNGVTLADIRREIDTILQEDFRREVSSLNYYSTSYECMARIETLYGSLANDNALSDIIANLRKALENLSSSPEVPANQYSVVTSAQEVARLIRSISGTVQNERVRADQAIMESITDINLQLEIIADINAQIPSYKARNHDTSGLEDQRDAVINKLAEYMDITYYMTDNGQVNVSTTAGISLVVNNVPATLEFSTVPSMNSTTAYPSELSGISVNLSGSPIDLTDRLRDGSIKALLELRDESLPSITGQLDQLSQQILEDLNRVHNRGANTPLGSGTSLADNPVMTSNRTFGNTAAAITLGSDIHLVIFDETGAEIGTHGTIPAGNTTISNVITDINSFLAGNGNVVLNSDGTIEIRMNDGLRLAFKDQGLTNNGGDAIVSFDSDLDSLPENYDGFSSFFGFNDLFTARDITTNEPVVTGQADVLGMSESFSVRQSILDNPSYISRGVAVLDLTSSAYSLAEGDNSIVLALAGAFEVNNIYESIENGPGRVSTTFSGYAAMMLSQHATNTNAIDTSLTFQIDLTNDIQSRFLERSGVNMDEELANMTIYQNSYNAAARVITVTTEMLDELMRLI